MVIDSKAVDPGQKPKKTLNEELHSTFSSPLAWILVLALLITWSGVFVIMFDLVDYKTVSGKGSLGNGHETAEKPAVGDHKYTFLYPILC